MLSTHQGATAPIAPASRAARERLVETANVVPVEHFRIELEREALRHGRYLSGFGLVCVGTIRDPQMHEILREAVETETRRTDVITRLADGSWAILAVCAADREVESLAKRIIEVAAEIADVEGIGPAPVHAAAASSGHRRIDAEELWDALGDAFREAAQAGSGVHFARPE